MTGQASASEMIQAAEIILGFSLSIKRRRLVVAKYVTARWTRRRLIVRMTELMREPRGPLDRADFAVYRRNGRELIPDCSAA